MKKIRKEVKRRRIGILTGLLLVMSIMLALAGCGGDGEESSGAQAKTDSISFETRDLDGNPVNSADLFAENKVTMINFWGTFCGPCIEEMPELEVISRDYADKGAAVIGLVIDVPDGDDALLKDAEKIVKDTGVTYGNLKAWNGLDKQLDISAVPTTFFVDSRGNLIGDPIIGADVEAYRRALDDYLKQEK